MDSPEAVLPVLRRRRSSPGARPLNNRARRKLLTALAVALLAAITLAWSIVSMMRLAGKRRSARSKRSLLGFSASRLAVVPPDLQQRHTLAVEDLLAHPLLNASRPLCSMSKVHSERYAPLHPSYGTGRHRRATRSRPLTAHDKPRHALSYFVALNLHSSASVLPTLIHTLHALVTSLGPERFTVSIYENGSQDATPAQLYLFARLLDRLGVGHTIVSSTMPKNRVDGKRIEGLAELRNLALRPLYDAPPGTWDRVLVSSKSKGSSVEAHCFKLAVLERRAPLRDGDHGAHAPARGPRTRRYELWDGLQGRATRIWHVHFDASKLTRHRCRRSSRSPSCPTGRCRTVHSSTISGLQEIWRDCRLFPSFPTVDAKLTAQPPQAVLQNQVPNRRLGAAVASPSQLEISRPVPKPPSLPGLQLLQRHYHPRRRTVPRAALDPLPCRGRQGRAERVFLALPRCLEDSVRARAVGQEEGEGSKNPSSAASERGVRGRRV